jgi:hypothetical protein
VDKLLETQDRVALAIRVEAVVVLEAQLIQEITLVMVLLAVDLRMTLALVVQVGRLTVQGLEIMVMQEARPDSVAVVVGMVQLLEVVVVQVLILRVLEAVERLQPTATILAQVAQVVMAW